MVLSDPSDERVQTTAYALMALEYAGEGHKQLDRRILSASHFGYNGLEWLARGRRI